MYVVVIVISMLRYLNENDVILMVMNYVNMSNYASEGFYDVKDIIFVITTV